MKVETLEGWTSPVIDSVKRIVFEADGAIPFHPDGCWDFAFFRRQGETPFVLRTGLTTKTVIHEHQAGDEILSVAFKPSSFMSLMPGEKMLDDAVALDGIGRDRFWLGGDVVEVPSFDNVDAFVERLIRNEIVADNPIVASVVDGAPKAMSERTMQRHFLKTTGMTYKHFTLIERAQKAMSLLQMGRPAADVAFALGYADQPHMIRSLKTIMGVTPGQLAAED